MFCSCVVADLFSSFIRRFRKNTEPVIKTTINFYSIHRKVAEKVTDTSISHLQKSNKIPNFVVINLLNESAIENSLFRKELDV